MKIGYERRYHTEIVRISSPVFLKRKSQSLYRGYVDFNQTVRHLFFCKDTSHIPKELLFDNDWNCS